MAIAGEGLSDRPNNPEISKSETTRSKLEQARTELLDLSTRNRLLNTPRRSKYARTVEVVNERSDQVFRLLVTQGKSFTFAPGRVGRASSSSEPPPEVDGVHGNEAADEALPQPEERETADSSGVLPRHADNKLQTLLTSEGLQARLLDLFYDARTFEEEQGVNILYLALGMLKWFDAPSSDVERFAPLILVPVSLERGTAAEKFRLRWIQEDAAPNLSLIAMLRREHGIILPEFETDEGFDPAGYFQTVAATVTSKPRWEVLADDVVLGFFSFSKFLMYRDLDPDNWPENCKINAHAIVSGLLGDGLSSEGSVIALADDDPIDPHISPEAMVHIVDADSSQTIAIEEARRGRNLIIQGPPGTGKSQTIANVIAAAVYDGQRVLFVAEKMAALEVVKRRLDNIGVGDICLELHSNKANKRAVLEELKRTWNLGRPRGNNDRSLLRKLGTLRDWLNSHSARLHRRHEPLGLSTYQVLGHLVRLQRLGLKPSEIRLPGCESWTRDDKAHHEQTLRDLAGRISEIGLPAQHVWRGVGLDAMLRPDLDRVIRRIDSLRQQLEAVLNTRRYFEKALAVAEAETERGLERLWIMASGAADAPAFDGNVIADACWDSRLADVADLVDAGKTYHAARRQLEDKLADFAWNVEVVAIRQHVAAHGASWLRWLRSDWRRANAEFRGLLKIEAPKSASEQLALLDRLIEAQNAAAVLAKSEEMGRQAFGARWRGEKSDWVLLDQIVEWTKRHTEAGFSSEYRSRVAAVSDRTKLAELTQKSKDVWTAFAEGMSSLVQDLKIDFATAFGVASLTDVVLTELLSRLDQWRDRAEDISKWIAYRGRAERAAELGLGELVAMLADGRLNTSNIIDEFEIAFYEAVFRSMVAAEPELGRFDGDAQQRLVEQFCAADWQRIELARLEVAAAHHDRMPRADGAAGPVGVLRGEMARKRGHLPIRQLMKRAGPAIQAIKPVFMMSPLSVAQFLEPGALDFDLLVIDEASQIQPVDALGAIARCGRMIVVGDDRQLPPTRFFAKMTGEQDEDDEDGTARVADIESILGLCAAKGMPSRMLRWHYRSKHQSLIAVSNSQFYENKLYIVPSPYTHEAGMGLRFHYLPNGVFDSGNTAVNVIEAKAVAEAVVQHAKQHPDLSLGVAAFSVKQRRAITDELERLRRMNPDSEEFFTKASPEPFFIKNLENIQGDERDVIFISVGYGKNAQGYMAMRFGPLSAEGGERRLNVLISRAKRRCEVFASITDEDIDLERGRGKGVAAFKLFLHFARTGKMSVGRPSDREHDSVFEEQVAQALRAEGYDVHAQVGLAGFFVDLAIADFERPGRYILGIECDGASYHSSRSARDRDRLRQAVLEDHGWIIHRIWSTDWFQRPQDQLRRTIAAIEAAKTELDARADRAATRRDRAVPIQVVSIDRANGSEVHLEIESSSLSVPYREASVPVPEGIAPHEVATGVMANLVQQIVAIEGPIHKSEITARVRGLWGLQRAGNRIQGAVEQALHFATREGRLAADSQFYSVPGAAITVRDRSEAASSSLRRPEMLPPAEIRRAITSIVEANLGASSNEIVANVSRLLGFKATSSQLRSVIEAEIAALVAMQGLAISGEILVPMQVT